MRRSFCPALLALDFCIALLAAACGSSSSGGVQSSPEGGEASTDSRAPKDVAPDVIIDPKNCVAPGTTGYCSPGGGQCDMAGPEGRAEICTADLKDTPAHDWYCTLSCSTSSPCSGGATCANMAMGSRCVPKSCDSFIPDSGPADSGPPDAAPESGLGDSAADGPHDGSTDASGADGH